jgi:hypothetical protein
MSMESSFEILSLIKGKWEVMVVMRDKAKAIAQAHAYLAEGLFSAIEVIEERFDEETGECHSFVVFNKVKLAGKTKEQYTGKERRTGKEWRQNPKKHGREHKEKSRSIKEKHRKATVGEEMFKGAVICLLS